MNREQVETGDRSAEYRENESGTNDKVPNSELRIMYRSRNLENKVPTYFRKSITEHDKEKIISIQDITPVSTYSIENSELSKEILGVNKSCDDSITHDYSAQKGKSVINDETCVPVHNNVSISENIASIAPISENSSVFEINKEQFFDKKINGNSERESFFWMSDSSVNGVQCCDGNGDVSVNKFDIETSGAADEGVKGSDLKSVEENGGHMDDFEESEEVLVSQSEVKRGSRRIDSSEENNNTGTKSVNECHISSSVPAKKYHKSEEQVQNQNENSEAKSEEVASKSNLTPSCSSRNLNKQEKYAEKDEETAIHEITQSEHVTDTLLVDPLQDDKEISKTRKVRKNVAVKNTKRLVKNATGSKGTKEGKKESTLVIIDTNSILSGRGPIPVSQVSPAGSLSVSFSSSEYSVLPIALPVQSMYPPIHLNTSLPTNQIYPQASVPVQSGSSPPQIFPTLTDDMYIIEAPSFIVPYVYEKPPIKPLREYLEQLKSEMEELKADGNEEKQGIPNSSQENGCSENEDNEEYSSGTGEGDDGNADCNGEEGVNVDQFKVNEEENNTPTSSSKVGDEHQGSDKDADAIKVICDSDNKSKTETVEIKEANSLTDSSIEVNDVSFPDYARKLTDSKQCNDGEKGVEEVEGLESIKRSEFEKGVKGLKNCEHTKNVEKVQNDLKIKDGNKSSYFDNPLGKFFMQIGINLVEEYVQTDLLRSQIQKNETEGCKEKDSSQIAINSLVKKLEISLENNEAFHFKQVKCEYCSFKTESSLVMAQHLETPHMSIKYVYRCNFCPLEVRSPHNILFHMEAQHNVRGHLDRAPAFHQCPNCPFENSRKAKLTRHMLSCDRKHKPERNQEPPSDWEPPAKVSLLACDRSTVSGLGTTSNQAMPGKTVHPPLQKLVPHSVLPSVLGASNGGQCQPPLLGWYVSQKPKAALRPIAPKQENMIHQPAANKSSAAMLLQQPNISITPLPTGMEPGGTTYPKNVGHTDRPGHSSNKTKFVICEICDGYIRDLEQLCNHMQWIHKVKIHPKMIYNRPPLNCQKCLFRFFTDQGLERHLLGYHGLVTSNIQEAANKREDGGHCPICGKVFQWRLLNHVASDHSMSLKPAHLSYKCTVCKATFGMYKQFENHVYSAHSVVTKRVIDKKVLHPQIHETPLRSLEINDEITIIPQSEQPQSCPNSQTSAVSATMPQNLESICFKQSLQQKQSSVEVIELEDSPEKKDKATDGVSFPEKRKEHLKCSKGSLT